MPFLQVLLSDKVILIGMAQKYLNFYYNDWPGNNF